MIDKEFGKRVVFLRKKAGLTQKKAADGIGVGYKTYQRYEAGYIPSKNNLVKIGFFYRSNHAWLRFGEGEIFMFEGSPENFLSKQEVKEYYKIVEKDQIVLEIIDLIEGIAEKKGMEISVDAIKIIELALNIGLSPQTKPEKD